MADDYEVGYCKPPIPNRFRPGQSGNPRGRPRRSRNLKTDLEEELRARVTVREGGRERRVSKQRAMVKRLAEKGLQGDIKAIGKLFELADRLLTAQEEQRPAAPLSAEEQAVLDTLTERFASPPLPGNANDTFIRPADEPVGSADSPCEDPPPAAEKDDDAAP